MMYYISNIAEFAKFNQLNTLDMVGCEEERLPRDEHFVRGLLMNLELLAHKWKLIDSKKYAHRFSN